MNKLIAFSAPVLFAGACLLTHGKQSASGNLGAFADHKDIGTTPKAGTAEYDPAMKEYRVTGGGANIWGKADAFQFVYTKVSGDVTLTADVKFVGEGVEHHRKAGAHDPAKSGAGCAIRRCSAAR